MSTATTETRPGGGAVRTPPAPRTIRGSLRVVLAQHRRTLTVSGVLVLLALVAAGGLRWWWESGGSSPDPLRRPPGALPPAAEYGGIALTLLPLLLGAFVAGPMVARELESGTYRLAWTQSVSPARWLAAKLALVLAGVLVAVPLLMVAYRLVRDPFVKSEYLQLPWYLGNVYRALGPVTVANAALGIALGALIGLLVQRTVLAAGAAFLSLGAVMLTVGSLREHLWPAMTRFAPADIRANLEGGAHSWEFNAGWQTASGERLDSEPCLRLLRSHPGETTFQNCMTGRGATQRYLDFHPQSDFWPLQLAESGILLGIAGLAAYAAFRVLRRTHA